MTRFRFLACIPLMLLVSASFAATKPPSAKPAVEAIPKVVRAQTFELTDSAGKTRAWLGTLADGTTVFKLLDKEGKPSVLVDSRGEIMVLDAKGTPRVTAGPMDDDYGIGVFDSKGTIRADVRVNSNDEPAVAVRDSKGLFRGTLLTLNDEPMFLLRDGKEDGARLGMHVSKSLPTFTLWDAGGKSRATYSLIEGGAPLLQMRNADGKTVAEVSAAEGQPSLLLECPGSGMSAFLGFTDDTDLSLMLLNDQDDAQVGLMLADRKPTIAVAHDNGEPGAGMYIGDDDVPFVCTSDKDGNRLWESLDELGPP